MAQAVAIPFSECSDPTSRRVARKSAVVDGPDVCRAAEVPVLLTGTSASWFAYDGPSHHSITWYPLAPATRFGIVSVLVPARRRSGPQTRARLRWHIETSGPPADVVPIGRSNAGVVCAGHCACPRSSCATISQRHSAAQHIDASVPITQI